MACCIIAALLYAHLKAMLRRWCMYVGLARVPAGVEFETLFGRIRRGMRARSARPVTLTIVR